MRTKTIEIDKSICDAIQALQIILNGLERLLACAVSNTSQVIPDNKINELKEEYFVVNAEYEMLKDKITRMIPEGFNPAKTTWNLNFENSTVVFNGD